MARGIRKQFSTVSEGSCQRCSFPGFAIPAEGRMWLAVTFAVLSPFLICEKGSCCEKEDQDFWCLPFLGITPIRAAPLKQARAW